MDTLILDPQEVLDGYDRVCALYPHVPPLSLWRAWEAAAYRHFALDGQVLDLGCGDGRYFRLIWPEARAVVGVDMDETVAALGRRSGVYQRVHVAAAHRVPEPDGQFDHVFANCSLEHMDDLDGVLAEVSRCLRPGGTLLCSVVTQRFVDWALLPNLLAIAGQEAAARAVQDDYLAYQHLANPLPAAQWCQRFAQAGLRAEVHVPILPQYSSGIFLLMDSLWHVKKAAGGEMGEHIHPFLAANPRFPDAFRSVMAGLLAMEGDRTDCSGAVFLVRKPGVSQ